MNLQELQNMTRVLSRDSNGYMFTNTDVDSFINQAIDRLKQELIFSKMVHLEDNEDVPNLLPEQYHYLLALFASSRCLEIDERQYEAVEKRNEFESLFADLMSEIQVGNVKILDNTISISTPDDTSNIVENTANYIDYVKDEYFNPHRFELGDEID